MLLLIGIGGTKQAGLFQFKQIQFENFFSRFQMKYHVGQIKEFVLLYKTKVEVIGGGLIVNVYGTQVNLLQAFDGYLSGILTKIFQLTDEIT